MQSQKSIAGVDVSAASFAACIQRGSNRIERTFANTEKDFRAFIKAVGPDARICMEATGSYHLGLALALDKAGIAVMVINPRVARDFARSSLQRSKTDKVDARVLLDYVKRMEFSVWRAPEKHCFDLRSMSRRIEAMVSERQAERNRLHAARAGGEPRVILKDIERSIEQIDKRIEVLEKAAVDLIRSVPALAGPYKRLTSMKGIAKRTALGLLGELMVLDPSMTARQIVAHAGLDPRHFESGSSIKGTVRISRMGNARLRRLMFFPALTQLRWNPFAAAYVNKLTSRGKVRMQAVVALMRKLLHVVWTLIHGDELFDPARPFPQEARLVELGQPVTEALPSVTAGLQPDREPAHPKGRSAAKKRAALEPVREEALSTC